MNGLSIEKTYLNATQAAKLIRKALKQAFPKTKFSVRSQYYSCGSSVHISYTNGPTSDSVEEVAASLVGGAYCDGMADMTVATDGDMRLTVDGPVVYRFGGYITARREIDEETAADFITRYVCEHPDASNAYGDSPIAIARHEMHKVAF